MSKNSPPISHHQFKFSIYLYYLVLAIIEISWLTYMLSTHSWHLFKVYWPASITMVFGSFVAGATAEGGAFVAFPVFTKVLHLSAAASSTFGLMIQSVGMSAATIFIMSLNIPVIYKVIRVVVIAGIIGVYIGIKYLTFLPELYPKLIFTALVTSFAIALCFNRFFFYAHPKKDIDPWGMKERLIFFLTGLIGGIFSAKTGTGANILTFIMLILFFDVNEKIAVPTSVIIMAIVSLAGFFIHHTNNSIGDMWSYWLVAVPIVAIGAPLGSFVAHKVTRDTLLILLLVLIAIEFVTTLVLLPLTLYLTMGLFVSILISGVILYYLLHRKHN